MLIGVYIYRIDMWENLDTWWEAVSGMDGVAVIY